MVMVGSAILSAMALANIFARLGMARIFTCAPGVAKIVLGQGWSSTGLPECFQFSQERLARLSNGDLPSIW